MEPFRDFKGLAVPYLNDNVDTDKIIPKQFLTSITKTGYGLFLFNDDRWLNPAKDATATAEELQMNPDFTLNQQRYQGAQILLCGNNFGCGSSREHAVWALGNYGFKAIIAPSFADIFATNASKNGLLLICLPKDAVGAMATACEKQPGLTIEIKLSVDNPYVTCTGERYSFSIDAGIKERLLEGLDDIALTERLLGSIKQYESERKLAEPWLDISSPSSTDK